MTVPPLRFQFPRALDPSDLVDFVATFSQDASEDSFLQIGESVASYSLSLPADAVAAGLEISLAAGYQPRLVGNDLTIWLTVDDDLAADPLFDRGILLPITLDIWTSSLPARHKERTLIVKAVNQ